MKLHMKAILESMDQNKNGIIEKNELSDKFLETYRYILEEQIKCRVYLLNILNQYFNLKKKIAKQ